MAPSRFLSAAPQRELPKLTLSPQALSPWCQWCPRPPSMSPAALTWGAQGVGRIEAGEQHPFRGHPVQIRGLSGRLSVHPQVAPPHLQGRACRGGVTLSRLGEGVRTQRSRSAPRARSVCSLCAISRPPPPARPCSASSQGAGTRTASSGFHTQRGHPTLSHEFRFQTTGEGP